MLYKVVEKSRTDSYFQTEFLNWFSRKPCTIRLSIKYTFLMLTAIKPDETLHLILKKYKVWSCICNKK